MIFEEFVDHDLCVKINFELASNLVLNNLQIIVILKIKMSNIIKILFNFNTHQLTYVLQTNTESNHAIIKSIKFGTIIY